jgi:hypothetical protein
VNSSHTRGTSSTCSARRSRALIVVAQTDRYDCDFVIEVHYRGKHRSGKVDVTHDGKPFRVSALADDVPATYIEDASGG